MIPNTNNDDLTENQPPIAVAIHVNNKVSQKNFEQNEEFENEIDQRISPEQDLSKVSSSGSISKYPLRFIETKGINLGYIKIRKFYINPVAYTFSLLILCALIIYCSLLGPDGSVNLTNTIFYGYPDQIGIANAFSWLFLGSDAFWLIFMLYLCIAHGKIKLGKEDPEFTNAEYFCLIFTGGAAMGIYNYGVGEGMGQQTGFSGNRFEKNIYLTQDMKDEGAVDQTIFDWGVNTFAPYALVGILTAYQTFVRGLPMSGRSLLYDFLGDYTWSWIGDVIDGYCIIAVMSGLLGSLGIAGTSLLAAFTSMDWMSLSTDEEQKNFQIIFVIVIIALSAVSAASGLNRGIKMLATIAVFLSTSLWIVIFFSENIAYILNIIFQEFGTYWSNIFSSSFRTDAFAQLKVGAGQAVDGLNAYSGFITYFPIYYQAWSMSWAPFVGMFYAKISKGRTVRECIGYCLIVSFFYYLLWFGLFSGGGIRMQRRAQELISLGANYFNDPSHFAVSLDDVVKIGNARTSIINETTGEPFVTAEKIPKCYDAGTAIAYNCTDFETLDCQYVNVEPDIMPVCLFADNTAQAWFDYLFQFKQVGVPLAYVSVICMVIFFITTSDSTGMIFDYLSSNGDEHHTRFQRVIWTLFQAPLSVILISAGTEGSSLKAAQSVCILASIPIVILLNMACINMIYSINHEQRSKRKGFAMPWFGGVFDVFETIVSFGNHHPERGATKPVTLQVFKEFLLSLFLPFYQIYRIDQHSSRLSSFNKLAYPIAAGIFWLGAIVFCAFNLPTAGVFYFWFVMTVVMHRNSIRNERKLLGNSAEDFFTSAIFYPNVIHQILNEVENVPSPDDECLFN